MNSGLIMLVTAPFIPIFMVLVGLKTKNKSEEKFAQLAEFSGTFLDSLQGLVSLKLYGRTNHQQTGKLNAPALGYRDATMGILRIAFTNTFMLESIVMLSIGVVALELAPHRWFSSRFPSTPPFDPAAGARVLQPVKNTGTAFHSGRTSMGAVRKVEEMLTETREAGAVTDGKREAGKRTEHTRSIRWI